MPYLDYGDAELRVATLKVAAGVVAREVQLADDVRAMISSDGVLIAVELDDTRRFGDPFDQAGVERAVAWAREQLAAGVAS